MTFDPNLPVRIASGYPVRIICTDRAGKYPIIALVTQPSGVETIHKYSTDGKNLSELPGPPLSNAPQKEFVNIWRNKNGSVACTYMPYANAEEAIRAAKPKTKHLRIAVEISTVESENDVS